MNMAETKDSMFKNSNFKSVFPAKSLVRETVIAMSSVINNK